MMRRGLRFAKKGVKSLCRKEKKFTIFFFIFSLRLNVFFPYFPKSISTTFAFLNYWRKIIKRCSRRIKTFAHKYKDISCPSCMKKVDETQSHILLCEYLLGKKQKHIILTRLQRTLRWRIKKNKYMCLEYWKWTMKEEYLKTDLLLHSVQHMWTVDSLLMFYCLQFWI